MTTIPTPIAAMRSPTEAMRQAASGVVVGMISGKDLCIGWGGAGRAFALMIDAALNPTKDLT